MANIFFIVCTYIATLTLGYEHIAPQWLVPTRNANLHPKAVLSNYPLVVLNILIISVCTSWVISVAPNNDESSFSLVCMLVPIAMILNNVLFFVAHVLLHHKKCWWIHCVHHKIHYPTAMGAFYQHPIETLVSTLVPLCLPPSLLGFPTWAVSIYIIIGIHQVIVAHTPFSWKPTDVEEKWHIIHHRSGNVNYGFQNAILDRLWGSVPPQGLPPTKSIHNNVKSTVLGYVPIPPMPARSRYTPVL
jgi:sterol desaturase/sphingolipid hydroxylase (fatty acid hydroxylase superfamily)